jgi:hypothetical protein
MRDGTMTMVAISMVVSEGTRRSVTVYVLMTAGCRDPVMVGRPRAVHHEGKRRHDRERGREAPKPCMDGTNHPSTEFVLRY